MVSEEPIIIFALPCEKNHETKRRSQIFCRDLRRKQCEIREKKERKKERREEETFEKKRKEIKREKKEIDKSYVSDSKWRKWIKCQGKEYRKLKVGKERERGENDKRKREREREREWERERVWRQEYKMNLCKLKDSTKRKKEAEKESKEKIMKVRKKIRQKKKENNKFTQPFRHDQSATEGKFYAEIKSFVFSFLSSRTAPISILKS